MCQRRQNPPSTPLARKREQSSTSRNHRPPCYSHDPGNIDSLQPLMHIHPSSTAPAGLSVTILDPCLVTRRSGSDIHLLFAIANKDYCHDSFCCLQRCRFCSACILTTTLSASPIHFVLKGIFITLSVRISWSSQLFFSSLPVHFSHQFFRPNRCFCTISRLRTVIF